MNQRRGGWSIRITWIYEDFKFRQNLVLLPCKEMDNLGSERTTELGSCIAGGDSAVQMIEGSRAGNQHRLTATPTDADEQRILRGEVNVG